MTTTATSNPEAAETASQKEERIHPFRVFTKQERLVALFCFLVSLITYWFTANPNIGLGDEGEMATAALHFGVMHPSAYPLWTILAGLFTRLPLGNGSWEINLFSGLCAATGVGVFSLLTLNGARWLGMAQRPSLILSLAGTMTFAWATPVWSQATIGKGLYAMHVCMMLVLMMLCYVWIRRPNWKNGFVWLVFLFSLGMSNHHMTLSMALLPLVVILLLHADLFWEYCIYSLLIASLLYLGFASIATDQYHDAAMKAAVRFFYLVITGFAVLLIVRRKLTEWRQGLLLVVAVVVGLSPYYYLRLASSTNPPMNWSYCSTNEGFFYAINRSQYWGTLADKLQGTVGKLVGVSPAEKAKGPKNPEDESQLQEFLGFFKRYWNVLFKNISPLPLLSVLLAFLLIWRFPREQRIWFYLLAIGFLLSAYLEPIMSPNGYDNPGWDMQKPWQGLSYGCFLILACMGASVLFVRLEQSLPKGRWGILLAAAAVACYTFVIGLPRSSQRGHWFGWMYGHDMLADLPRDSFVFGGTDPGRFVPTYMVFGESFEKLKRDPSFDRRDLYIVTQNALADTFYNRYIRSHYTTERPTEFSWFERLLGRDKTYPPEYLTLPHREEIMSLFNTLMAKYQQNPATTPNPQSDPVALNSAVGEWIFLHNRDKKDGTPRHFYVEESFPMEWSYPYAIPHGLCYEINHDKLDALPQGTAEKDLAWWDDYIKKLESVNGFWDDGPAQHSFAKLRNTGGNIYAYRNMLPEAERAYRQALYLWPGNTETTGNMVNLLTREQRYKDAYDLVAGYLPLDPNSKVLKRLLIATKARYEASQILGAQQALFSSDPKNHQYLAALIQSLMILGRQEELDATVQRAISASPDDVPLLRDMINFYASQGRYKQALDVTESIARLHPDQWDVQYTLAKFEILTGSRDDGFASLQQAIARGGNLALQQIGQDPFWRQFSADPSFQKALQGSQGIKTSESPTIQSPKKTKNSN